MVVTKRFDTNITEFKRNLKSTDNRKSIESNLKRQRRYFEFLNFPMLQSNGHIRKSLSRNNKFDSYLWFKKESDRIWAVLSKEHRPLPKSQNITLLIKKDAWICISHIQAFLYGPVFSPSKQDQYEWEPFILLLILSSMTYRKTNTRDIILQDKRERTVICPLSFTKCFPIMLTVYFFRWSSIFRMIR